MQGNRVVCRHDRVVTLTMLILTADSRTQVFTAGLGDEIFVRSRSFRYENLYFTI